MALPLVVLSDALRAGLWRRSGGADIARRRRGRVVAPPVVLVALLAPLTVGWDVAADVAAKAAIGVVAAVLLGATTAFPALVRGLEALRLPRLMVLIAALMYRYLFVVVAEVGRMRDALASRAYAPRHALQAPWLQ